MILPLQGPPAAALAGAGEGPAETDTTPDAEPAVGMAADLGVWLREVLPADLQGGGFLLEPWQWLGLATLIFLAVVIDRVVRAVADRVTHVVAARVRKGEEEPAEGTEEAEQRDLSIVRFRRPIGIWVGALVFVQLLPALDLTASAFGVLELRPTSS